MVYSYNKTTKKVRAVKMPKIKGEDAERIKAAEAPNDFLTKVKEMKLRVTRA